MGILNLLREFGPATRSAHLSDFAHRTLGVDAMCWMHRAAFCCALELVRSADDPLLPHPTRYLYWLRRMVRMLLHFKITPIFVFDGGALPAKNVTNTTRDTSRAEWKARGDAYFAAGRLEEASDAYGKCINVSSEMIRNFQHLLTQEQVKYIIAPYEADAQIGYLYKRGLISAAITEDSDLLPYGCRKILIKLDREGGCKEIDLDAFEKEQWSKQHYPVLNRLRRIMATPTPGSTPDIELEQAIAASSNGAIVPPVPPPSCNVNFIHACVLSGCDYLPSLHGIGLKKAIQWVDDFPKIDQLLYHLKANRKKLEEKWRKEHEAAIAKRKEAVGSSELQDEGDAAEAVTSKMSTQEYITHFYKAVLTFQHQLIYDPETRSFKHLAPLPPQLQALYDKAQSNGHQHESAAMQPMSVDDEETDAAPTTLSSSSSSSSSSTLPSSHPLLQVTDFSFLGPSIPSHLIESYISGKIDPKTLEKYDRGWKVTDLNEVEQKWKEQRLTAQQMKRQSSAQQLQPSHPSVASFFTRAASSDSAVPTKPAKPFSLGSAVPVKPFTVGASSVASRARDEDSSQLDDFFSEEEWQEMERRERQEELQEENGNATNSGEESQTQQIEEMFDETLPSDDGAMTEGKDASSANVSRVFTPPPPSSSSSSNPFAVRAHKPLDEHVTTFADAGPVSFIAKSSLASKKPFENITASVLGGEKKATTAAFLSKIFGNRGTSTTSSVPISTGASSLLPSPPVVDSNPLPTMTKSIPAPAVPHSPQSKERFQPVTLNAPVESKQGIENDDQGSVCDLTGDNIQQENGGEGDVSIRSESQLQSNTRTPARTMSTNNATPHSAPMTGMKRKTSSTRSHSSSRKSSPKRRKNGMSNVTVDKSLLAFFGKAV